MMNMKRFICGVTALALSIALVPAGFAKAAEPVKEDGYENGGSLDLTKLGSYVSGISNLDGGVAEIVSYDSKNNNAWVVNGATGMLDILDLDGIACAVSDSISAESLDIKSMAAQVMPDFHYGDMTSVSVNSEKGIAAVALQAADYDQKGYVGLLTADGELAAMIEAGVQPDMLTFTPDGTKILVANEGEPREGYGESVTDPDGSVTIVTVNADDLAASSSVTVGFDAYDAKRDELVASGIMLGKGNAPSADLEPEYIACDNTTAYVTLQEANAIAVLDLASGSFTGVYSMGYQDLSLEENALDLVQDGEYVASTYPDAVGAYMPDGISLYHVDGKTYLLTANEGDAREWGSGETEFCNEIKESLMDADGNKVKKVRVVDPEVTDGLPEDKNVLFGSRSFSIYEVSETGLTQVFDSGSDFESLTAEYLPDYFNCSNDDNELDSRSPKKGPEAESVTVGAVDGQIYAFVALERIGGVMVYDITDPENAEYVNYINTRDFSENPEDADPEENPGFYLTGDVAPEGLYFISGEASPSGTPILLAAFEVSGTVSAYAVGEAPEGHNYVAGTCTTCGYFSCEADETCELRRFTDLSAALDADAGKWYHEAVEYVLFHDLMNGMKVDVFAPDESTSRAMIVTTLYRMAGSPEVEGKSKFTDVKEDAWYTDAVIWAEQRGVVKGYGNGKFCPNDEVTREQIAAIFQRYAADLGMDVSQTADLDYTDTAEIHQWAVESVEWASACGLMEGMANGSFAPRASTTRAELATMLMRWCREF